MIGPAATAGERGSPSSSSPPWTPLLLLRPAHLRFYGFDAEPELSRPSPRHQDAGSDPATVIHPLPTPTAVHPGSSARMQQQQQQRAEGSAEPGAGGSSSRNRRQRKVPMAPPALSARCQVHPAVLQDLGACPGDSVVALTLPEGWASNRAHQAAPATARASPGGDRESGVDAAGGAPGGVSQRGVQGSGQGVEGLALDPEGGGEEQVRQTPPREKVGEQQQHKEQPPDVGEERRRQEAALLSEAAASLRCLLCTVWANPHLAPDETAVDGRVNLSLPPTSTAAAAAAAGVAAVQRQLGTNPTTSMQPTPCSPPLPDPATPVPPETARPNPSTTTDPAVRSLLTQFLRTAIERHAAASGRDSSGGSGSDPVVGVVPVHSLRGGFGGGGWVPPLAGRVSARIIGSSTQKNRAPELANAASLGGDSGESEPRPAAGHGSNVALGQQRQQQRQQHQQQPRPQQGVLPPEYTSLVKRSLRHLLVCDGCKVAVPSCPDSTGPTAQGSDSGGGSGNTRGQQRPPQDGTALVRIDTGSCGGGYESPGDGGGPLSALVGGGVCAIGPESLVLVENKGGQSVETAGSSAGTCERREGARAGGVRGGGAGVTQQDSDFSRRDVARKVGVKARGGSKTTPTEALVELMLLPMTAATAPDRELKPLEFLVPRGVLLTGPPGVGKTFAVRSAVETVRNLSPRQDGPTFQVRLTTLNGAEILSLGQWEACRALREAFSAAESWSSEADETDMGARIGADGGGHARGNPRRTRCAVIFLDEADALLARRDRDGDKAGGGEGARALAQLLTLMDGFRGADGSSHVVVVGATNRPGAIDPALRRPGRLDQELALAPPDARGRAAILRHHLRGVQVAGGVDTIETVAAGCVGYVGADLAALAREAALSAARSLACRRPEEGHGAAVTTDAAATSPKGIVGLEDISLAMEKVGASSLRGHQVTVPNTPWSDIGGVEEAKAKLRQAVEWPVANKAAFDRLGLTPPRGILLFGPPGCSKTTLVRAAATAAGATFVCLSGADVFSPYLGEAEAAVRQAFRIARNAAPAMLFFDEIDAVVCKRGGEGKGSANSAESRVLATFLTEMDGVGSRRGDGVVVVAATNRPEAVDRALLRPGRFDQVVYAPLPDDEARRQIFEVHTRKLSVDGAGVDFAKLAAVSKGLTGAEIEGACREAAMSAIREAGFGGDGDISARSATSTTNSEASRATNSSVLAANTTAGGAGTSNPGTQSSGSVSTSDTAVLGRRNRGGQEGGAEESAVGERPQNAGRGGGGGATVTMRHLVAAARASASRPGVTREMIQGYDRFASGLG
eukprot:g17985.t1